MGGVTSGTPSSFLFEGALGKRIRYIWNMREFPSWKLVLNPFFVLIWKAFLAIPKNPIDMVKRYHPYVIGLVGSGKSFT